MSGILSIYFVFIIVLSSFPIPLFAEITVDCLNCHTMHNSQDGGAISASGAAPYLLKAEGNTPCWGCHAQGAAYNIDSVTGAPQVRHKNTSDLAGGNFAYITGDKEGKTGDTITRGHNVIDTGVIDNNFSSGIFPPGDEFSQSGDGFTNTSFTCAGKFGCHGDRSVEDGNLAIRGAHHTITNALKFGSIDENAQGSTVGTSYRFLLGVKGGEDSDWQATVSADDHNEYKGATSGVESTKLAPGGNTVSGFCAECHGNFHGDATDTGGISLWKRHPTDISLPGTGTEYAVFTNYRPETPVARTEIPGSPSNTVDPTGTTDDIVMCLSCHMVHASPYSDILRWNYEDMVVGTTGDAAGTGCFACHSSKDGV